ncbi:MAG: hypothetical protein ACUVRJ_08535 [Candidatus Villigracilaceae bacterium]
MTRKRKKHTPIEKQVEDRFDAVEKGKISDCIAFLVDPFLWNLGESHGDVASGHAQPFVPPAGFEPETEQEWRVP